MHDPGEEEAAIREVSSQAVGPAAIWALLDTLHVGIVVLDAVGGVVARNGTAQRILGAGECLVERDGVLEPAVPPGREPLRGFLDAVCTAEPNEDGRGLALSRGDNRRPLEVIGVPLGRAAMAGPGATPAALVFLHDPEVASHVHRERLLRDLYRLTGAEARVAALLLDGCTVDEAARELGSSRHTVRTHVKHVLAKTSTRSQTDLVRLVLSGPIGLLRTQGDGEGQ